MISISGMDLTRLMTRSRVVRCRVRIGRSCTERDLVKVLRRHTPLRTTITSRIPTLARDNRDHRRYLKKHKLAMLPRKRGYLDG